MSAGRGIDVGLVAGAAVVFGGALLMTLQWPAAAAAFPRLICGLGLGLSLLAGGVLLLGRRGPGPEPAPEGDGRRQVVALGWTVGFFLAVLLLGFQVGLPLVVGLYTLLVARSSLWVCGTMAVAGAAFIWLARAGLHLPMYTGLLLGG